MTVILHNYHYPLAKNICAKYGITWEYDAQRHAMIYYRKEKQKEYVLPIEEMVDLAIIDEPTGLKLLASQIATTLILAKQRHEELESFLEDALPDLIDFTNKVLVPPPTP